ncbi:MAG: rubredoxin-like domain-containing protein [Candidatus Thorarchaeota archaeon]
MKWKCDNCGYEFESDNFPEEDFKCPSCGDSNCTFSLVD